jgi:hypothetical protein
MMARSAFSIQNTSWWQVGLDCVSSLYCSKLVLLTVGVTGELPKLPHVPGLQEFEAAGGAVVHSSRHKTTPDMRGKKAIIVGAATSAHDLGWELYERGLDVTMIQVGEPSIWTGLTLTSWPLEELNFCYELRERSSPVLQTFRTRQQTGWLEDVSC